MKAYKVGMIAVVKGMFEARALIEGDAELGIEPPVLTLATSIEGMITGGIDEFDIAIGLVPCVIPAFEDAADTLVSVGTDMEATLSGQVELFGTLGI